MSHELRTPLNGVLGYAQLLQRDRSLNAAQREALEAICQVRVAAAGFDQRRPRSLEDRGRTARHRGRPDRSREAHHRPQVRRRRSRGPERTAVDHVDRRGRAARWSSWTAGTCARSSSICSATRSSSRRPVKCGLSSPAPTKDICLASRSATRAPASNRRL